MRKITSEKDKRYLPICLTYEHRVSSLRVPFPGGEKKVNMTTLQHPVESAFYSTDTDCKTYPNTSYVLPEGDYCCSQNVYYFCYLTPPLFSFCKLSLLLSLLTLLLFRRKLLLRRAKQQQKSLDHKISCVLHTPTPSQRQPFHHLNL